MKTKDMYNIWNYKTQSTVRDETTEKKSKNTIDEPQNEAKPSTKSDIDSVNGTTLEKTLTNQYKANLSGI